MSTLKICTSKTIWICNVTNIIQLGEFTLIPKEGVDFTEQDIFTAAGGGNVIPKGTSCVVHQVAFEFGDSTFDIQGVALMVKTLEEDRENEIWLIPRRSAFLMSDSGATIDRI